MRKLKKYDFKIAKNIYFKEKEKTFLEIDEIVKESNLLLKFDFEIKNSIIYYKKNEKEDFLEIFWNIKIEDFWDEFYYKIKEYEISRPLYLHKKIKRKYYWTYSIFKVFCNIYSKENNYKLTIVLEFDNNFKIIDNSIFI